MCRSRRVAAASIALILSISAARAETPRKQVENSGGSREPARLLPAESDLLVQAPEPRRLVETLLANDTLKQLRQLAPIGELLDSTTARRFLQLTGYFEKELGAPWPKLLERLAGRGAAVGVQFGPNPAPVLAVIEGDDDQLTAQFFQLALRIAEQELARQEAKEMPIKGSYKGDTTARIGTAFYAAVAGAVLLLSNSETALHAGLDRYHDGGKKSMANAAGLEEAAKLLPPHPLLTLWLNMEKLRQSPAAKVAYQAPPRDDPFQTVVLGRYLDLLGRSPFVCAALAHDDRGLLATVRLPRGRDGADADKLLHLPPAGAPGSRPLLEPQNVIYSGSDYFNIANIWKERKALFNDKQVKQFEKFDKQSSPFLLGNKIGKLLTQAGPYYRVVIAHQSSFGYKTTPKINIPAFALVWELTEPEAFAKSMEGILRAAALLLGGQVNLQLVEEKYRDCRLIGYRFPEKEPLKGDINDLRFNFAPCFARVGDQFVAASTLDLCRELVDLLRKEGTSPARGHASAGRDRFYAAGAAAYLHSIEDFLVTQTALDRALTPAEARRQVQAFLEVIHGLGALTFEPRYHAKTFQYDIRLGAEK